jgi:hypothetical protein
MRPVLGYRPVLCWMSVPILKFDRVLPGLDWIAKFV